MNYFMLAIGLQYFGATYIEFKRKQWAMVVVYLCYGVSAIALGFVGGHK